MKPKWTVTVVFAALVFMLQSSLYGSIPNETFTGQGPVNVKGMVSDINTGVALPGVSIQLKGTSQGTITDEAGNYSIDARSGDILVFSYIGYLTEEVVVGNTATINMSLAEDIIGLDELVVIGYGTQKKSDLTGAVASVSMEDMQKIPNVGVGSMLQGMASGVMVLENSGQPGAEPVIRVRGLATVNGGSPLIVIDGISGGRLSDLNPADIEAIEILKDAASQAIYGQAGGNGVILVTTKKGKEGKLRVNFDAFAGVQYPWKSTSAVADGQEYASLYNQNLINKGQDPYFPGTEGAYTNPDNGDLISSTNWLKEIFRPALVQNYNISLSGGSKVSTVFMGFNYSGEQGTIKGTSNDRLVFRLNSEHKFLKRITVGENFNLLQSYYVSQDERNEYNSPLSCALQMLPLVPIYAQDESGNYAYREAGLSANIKNPLAQIEYNNNISKSLNLSGSAFARVEIIKGLTFESRIGVGYNPAEYRRFTPEHYIGTTASPNPSQSQPSAQYTYNISQSNSWQWQNFFNYNVTIAQAHNLGLTAGYESSKNTYQFTNRNQVLDTVTFALEDWQSFAYGDTLRLNGPPRVTPDTKYSQFFRLNYDYKGILLVQYNIRRDGSSKFGPNNRFGIFSSYSVGLKFSEFGFIKDLDVIDFGKVRFGYGETGNSDIQPGQFYGSISSLPMHGYAYNGTDVIPGAALVTAGNLDLGWETVVTLNAGLDLRFLQNRLGLSFDLFTRRNEGMLLRPPVPYSVGYIVTDAGNELGDANIDTRPLQNYGTLDNRGIEITASYKGQAGKLKYEAFANFTRAITTIDIIGEEGQALLAGSGRGITNVNRTMNGGPVAAFYGYQTDGVYQEEDFVWVKAANNRWRYIAVDPNGAVEFTGTDINGAPITVNSTAPSARPGDQRYVDVNGDGAISSADYVQIGDPNPDFTYGFGASFEYSNFDLNFFFQGSQGNDIFNLLKVNYYNMENGGLNVTSDLENSYIPAQWQEGTPTSAPVLLSDAQNTGTGIKRMDGPLSQSDFFVEDGSYLRLKNLQLGYTFPVSSLQMLKMQKLRLYVSAMNLLTITSYTGFDPEVNETSILERGLDRGTYPQSRMYTIGVNCIF